MDWLGGKIITCFEGPPKLCASSKRIRSLSCCGHAVLEWLCFVAGHLESERRGRNLRIFEWRFKNV